jgi:hypothetical protein
MSSPLYFRFGQFTPALAADRNLFSFVRDIKLNVDVLARLIPWVSALL